MTSVTVIVHEGISTFTIKYRWNFYNFKIPAQFVENFGIYFLFGIVLYYNTVWKICAVRCGIM